MVILGDIGSLFKAIWVAIPVFLAASLVISSPSLYAGEVLLLEKNGIRVFFGPNHEQAAKEVADIYPELRSELKGVFGWDLSEGTSVLLVGDRRQFRKMTGNDLIVAFAVPKRDLVVIDHSKMNIDPFSLRNILKHELCHLLLHQHIKIEPLPRWLDEGVAQWVSDGVGDIIFDQKRSLLNRAAFTDSFIPISALRRDFPRNNHDLILAYEESKSLVDYIIGRFGKEGMLDILRHMRRGESDRVAVLRSVLISLNELEEDWHRSLRQKMRWFAYLSYYLYEILFVFAALVTVYASIKIVLRKRAYMKEME